MDPLKYEPRGVLIANCSYQQHGESTQYSTTPSCLHTKKPLPMVPTTFVPLLKLLVKKMTIMKLRHLAISTNQEPLRNPVSCQMEGLPRLGQLLGTSLSYEERREPRHRFPQTIPPLSTVFKHCRSSTSLKRGCCYEHRPLGKRFKRHVTVGITPDRFKRVTSHLTSDRNTLTNTRYSGTPKSCNHNDTTGKWCHSTLFSHWIISRS